MERRLVCPLFAAVGLAALTGSRVGLANGATPPPGTITTVAGTGQPGFSGDGGPATAARLNPWTLTPDGAGNLFIEDSGSVRVRKVSPEGIITTVAGSGKTGFSGDGGPATEARFSELRLGVVDTAGNLFIADRNNHRIRKAGAR